jgi:RNA polymerase sigma factor for flagellar operon FliA
VTYTAAGKIDQETLLNEYLPVVRRQALALQVTLSRRIEFDDIVQAGIMGLLDAWTRYDPTTGMPFTAFARQRIRGAMIDELRIDDWLPRRQRQMARRLEAAMGVLEQRLGRPPDEREVADKLGLSLEDYRELLGEINGAHLLPFEEYVAENGEPAAHESTFEEPDVALQNSRIQSRLRTAIDRLPHREKLLMALYYQEDLNLKEIGEVLGVTESRVCQLHSQAIRRLRSALAREAELQPL